MSSEPKDLLDKILAVQFDESFEVGADVVLDRQFANDPKAYSRYRARAIKKAKQQILTHFISYEEVERLIGENRSILTSQSPETARQINIENQLKEKLKAALKKRRES